MRVFQIYFNEGQRSLLHPEYLPFYNFSPTVFFESQVILDLCENGHHLGTDYFGVVSYKLYEKIGIMRNNWRDHPNIADISTQEFTPRQFREQLYKGNPDAMSFQCHAPHDPIMIANAFHPRFKEFWNKIMVRIGYHWSPVQIQNIFYCNFFVAKSEVYDKYIKEMLAPAINEMNLMPELFEDCGYRGSEFPDNLKKKFDIENWPYHAFLCERMFTYFAHIHNLKCLHY